MCVELSPTGEREKNLSLIIRSVRQILGKPTIDVFVPAVSEKVRGESQTMVYMDGYVFVRYEDGVQYQRLQETTFFHSILRTTSVVDGQRKHRYSLLEDKDLDPMRTGVENLKLGQDRFTIGQKVKISKGSYKNLCGEVLVVYDEHNVQILVRLLSKPVLIDYPVSYLQKVS